jgi:hypothetical protein
VQFEGVPSNWGRQNDVFISFVDASLGLPDPKDLARF